MTVICVHDFVYCLHIGESHGPTPHSWVSVEHMPVCCHISYSHTGWQARRKARKALEGEEGVAAEEDNGQPARVALNTLRAARPGGPRPRQGRASSNTAAGLSRPKREGLFAAGSDSENQPSGGVPPLNLQSVPFMLVFGVVWLPSEVQLDHKSRGPELVMAAGLDIFVDDAFRAGGSSAAPPVPETSNTGETGWRHLGTFEQTRKENMQKPGKWAGMCTSSFLSHQQSCMRQSSSSFLSGRKSVPAAL